MRHFVRFAAAGLAAFLVPACGGGGGGSSSADTTPPAVVETTPSSGETRARPEHWIEARFDEAMDAATLVAGALTLETAGGVPVAGTVSKGSTYLFFSPDDRLVLGASYTARLSGAVADPAGNALGADLVWTFTVTPAWHVDFNAASGNGTGENWANALTHPNQLFTNILLRDGDEIRFADGTQGMLGNFVMLAGLSFRGGYAGDGAPDPDLRTTGSTTLQFSTPIEPADGTSWDGFLIENQFSAGNGGAFAIDGKTGVVLENCVFRGNRAQFGGAIWSNFSTLTVRGCVFERNEASATGGAMKIFGGSALLDRCRFTANKAVSAAGAVECSGAVTAVNCVLDGNRGPTGAGLWFTSPNGKVNNCTFTGQRGDYAVSLLGPGGGCEARFSIVWGNAGGDVGPGVTNYYSHVGGASPLFVAGGSWDTLGTPSLNDDVWIAGDYRLQLASPDRDFYSPNPGDPTEDYDALPRPVGPLSDLGAFEVRP